MKLLCFFILGFIFAAYLIPLLDGLSSWFLTWIDLKKIKLNEIINQINIKMRQAAASAEEDPPRRSIGFRVPDEEEEYEEDEV